MLVELTSSDLCSMSRFEFIREFCLLVATRMGGAHIDLARELLP